MTTILAIDQGTSGTKAVVVGEDAILALAEVALRPQYLADGAVEQDPQDLWDSVLEAGRQACARAQVPIDAVALANQGESVLAWDLGTGAALTPILGWQDRRAEEVCAGLREHADLVSERTGLVLDPYFAAPKQAWIRRNRTRTGVVTMTDSWLLHRLTGEFVTDAATASRSLLTSLDTADWDADLLAVFGLDAEPLPRVLACDEVAGTTTAFGAEVPVAGLIVDQQAALLAQGCIRPGDAKCTFGTGAFLLANVGTTARRPTTGLAASVAWRLAGTTTYCFDGQVYTAASAVRWLESLGFIGSPADLDDVAAEDAQAVLAVPALAGLAAPWWRPQARASFSGMSLATGPEHLVLAVLQGIAAQIAEIADLVAGDVGTSIERLRVDGGLTQSRVLMQAVADLMQVGVDVYPSAHATPLGAAALARIALDPGRDLADAIVPWQPSGAYEPAWSADRVADFRRRWSAAAAAC